MEFLTEKMLTRTPVKPHTGFMASQLCMAERSNAPVAMDDEEGTQADPAWLQRVAAAQSSAAKKKARAMSADERKAKRQKDQQARRQLQREEKMLQQAALQQQQAALQQQQQQPAEEQQQPAEWAAEWAGYNDASEVSDNDDRPRYADDDDEAEMGMRMEGLQLYDDEPAIAELEERRAEMAQPVHQVPTRAERLGVPSALLEKPRGQQYYVARERDYFDATRITASVRPDPFVS